ncbi:protein FAM136A-like [Orcinus orca]|uniref:protein FAM136A-like n=1 Tax=Orcinus orca TaxID=9733 RepID=UPI0014411666|nr:protein FAM136A-like [Orcinus orca]
MAELQQLRAQEAVDSMMKSLERENIWKMQGLTYWCSAGCCEDSQASMQQVHQCIERCHAPLAQAQALVTSELEKFQDCLARCTMHCNNNAKDSIDAGSKELQVKRQLESCVTKCVDDHMNLIPTMTKKMKECLSSIGK